MSSFLTYSLYCELFNDDSFLKCAKSKTSMLTTKEQYAACKGFYFANTSINGHNINCMAFDRYYGLRCAFEIAPHL